MLGNLGIGYSITRRHCRSHSLVLPTHGGWGWGWSCGRPQTGNMGRKGCASLSQLTDFVLVLSLQLPLTLLLDPCLLLGSFPRAARARPASRAGCFCPWSARGQNRLRGTHGVCPWHDQDRNRVSEARQRLADVGANGAAFKGKLPAYHGHLYLRGHHSVRIVSFPRPYQ